MRLFDLSQPLTDDGPNCPAHPPVRLRRMADHPADGWRLEQFDMASHTGTHLDAPLHKLAGGMAIDAFPLDAFVGPVRVADLAPLAEGQAIGAADLRRALGDDPLDGRIVLLHTGWGAKRAKTPEWLLRSPYLAPEGAAWLVARGAKGIGIDHFSLGGMGEPDNARTHEIVLGAGLWIVEDLYFREGWREALARPGAWFQAFPLLLPGFSGSPCRALLFHPTASSSIP
jgi:arylformamidase